MRMEFDLRKSPGIIVRALAISALVLTPPVQSALISSFQQTGTLDIDVTAVGLGSAPVQMGNLTLGNLPPTSLPVQGFLYAMDTNHPGQMSASFNGTPLGAVAPYATDSAFNTLYTFRWDVTAFLGPGINNHTYQINQIPDQFMNSGIGIGVVALAVVYSDPSAGQNVATLFDGMIYVGNPNFSSETIGIAGVPPGTGTSVIRTVTYLDDNFNGTTDTGEVVSFNGNTIGGPLDGNLGLNGSLNQWSGTTVAGADMMNISTQTDEFGWVLTSIVTPVPLPASGGLLAAGLILYGRRRIQTTAST
jgi:hypothetical protein